MTSFALGVIVGFLLCGTVAAVWAVTAVRRFSALAARTREAERLAELGTLTGGLAHEIKNPLSTVQLNLQLLAEDIDPNHPRLANRLRTVTQETARLREILEDFLRYAGRMELEKKPADLCLVAEELVDFFYPQAQVQKVQLRLSRPQHAVMAWVDIKLIKQALLNLMLNAVQAMSGGGDLILAVRQEGRHACIDVTDTGPGIPPESLGRIFDAYYSTKKGGTGLGLAMTRRIVREHGGELSVQSELGRGTRFTMKLPLMTEGGAAS
ncbi:MAG: ATP-binding protein [Phycisphaerae bacterium]|nr:ATP-binding protein [Phycisphaerae bacterium]MDW8261865.1 ATP-binding protein [Phycisphaerales bacterium]